MTETDSAQEQARKAGAYLSSLERSGRARVAAMVALCAAQCGTRAADRYPDQIETGVFDVRLRYNGGNRVARWNALVATASTDLDPKIACEIEASRDACEAAVHTLVSIWCKYNLAPESTLAILDLTNPSWLTGFDHAGALALLFPTVAETRAWVATGAAPSIDEALFLIGLRSDARAATPA